MKIPSHKSFWRETAWPFLKVALLALAVFWTTFSLMQEKSTYYATVGKFLTNCQYNETEGYLDLGKQPYWEKSYTNLTHWDAKYYNFIQNEGYHIHPEKGKQLVPFFPLFPAIWKVSQLPIKHIGFLNFALFVLGLLLLASVLLKNLPGDQSVIILCFCLFLPCAVVFQMPYSEAASFVAFAAAVWAWFEKKTVWFYFFLLLFSLSRPVSGIVGMAFLCTTLYFTLLGKATPKLWLHTGISVLVLLAGPLLYFAFHYTFYDDFWIFFTMQRQWDSYFRIPAAFTDWSFESLAISVFGFFGVVLPFSIGTAVVFFRNIAHRKTARKIGFFSEDRVGQKEYLGTLALAFGIGLTLFIVFFQGGSLHSYARYLLAGPFGIILLMIGCEKLLDTSFPKRILLVLLPVIPALLLWNQLDYHWEWNFRDAPYFLLLALSIVWICYDKVPKYLSWSFISMTGLLCIIFQTHLYNYFLMECWLFL